MLGARFDANNIQNMNNHEKQPEHAPDHNQAPWHLMWPLIFLSDRALFRVCEQTKRDQGDADAGGDDPVEQSGASSRVRGVCGVFAQKNGIVASSQMARYAARECKGQ